MNFDRHLVGRTADAAAADLNARLHVVQRIMEHADRLTLQAGFDGFERAVDDSFGDGLLTVQHDTVHKLGQDDVPELRIGEDFALFGATTTGHMSFLSLQPDPGLRVARGLLL